jgi:homoserine kinase
VELDLPPLALHGVNRIPLERGLGSSAAAAVAGLLLGCRLAGTDLSLEELLELAVEIEGHADNVAAALLGGLVNVYRYRGRWRVATASPAPLLRPVVLVPETARLPTSEARDALPADVPLADAAFNAGRAALVWRALTADPELLAEALEDRLHEKVRLALVPPSGELFQTLRDAGVPVCVSGAGPSLLAFESEEHRVPDPGPGWRALRIPVRPVGADVL